MRDRLASIALAAGFVLAGAADWGLVSRDTVICAKSRETCETALEAVRRGWLRDWPPDARCVAMPGCFSDESECIAGYNCAQ